MSRNSEVLISEDPRGLSRANGVALADFEPGLAAGQIVMLYPAHSEILAFYEGSGPYTAPASGESFTVTIDDGSNSVEVTLDETTGADVPTSVVYFNNEFDAAGLALTMSLNVSADGFRIKADDSSVKAIGLTGTGVDDIFGGGTDFSDYWPANDEGYIPFHAGVSDPQAATIAVNLNKCGPGEMITVIDCLAQIKDELVIWGDDPDPDDEAEARVLLAAKFIKAR